MIPNKITKWELYANVSETFCVCWVYVTLAVEKPCANIDNILNLFCIAGYCWRQL